MNAPAVSRGRGFTLLELMLVVAIIGVIATIALPTFQRFKLRARSAEAGTNLAAIRVAQRGYFSEYSEFVAASASPATHGGSMGQAFADTGGGFAILGWAPEGNVFFQYAVAVSGVAFTADAAADIDNDGVVQVWGYVHPSSMGVTVTGELSCTGVVGAGGGTTNIVGPCSQDCGRSIF